MPKVTVLMPVFNGEAYVRQAVQSILTQTCADFELLIIDDGSCDKTPEILKKFAAGDQCIRVMTHEKNIGIERTLNEGLRLASGEYVARQDADDWSLPGRLERQADFLDQHPETVLVTSAVKFHSEAGEFLFNYSLPADHENLEALLLINNVIRHSSVMLRRRVAIELGGYDQSMRYAEDYDLWWRMSRYGKLAALPDFLSCYRIRKADGVTRNYRAQQMKMAFQISLRAVREMLDHSGLPQIDAQAYERFWRLYHARDLADGKKFPLRWQDIARLAPLWELLKLYPQGAWRWRKALLFLATDCFCRSHAVGQGMKLFYLAAAKFQTARRS